MGEHNRLGAIGATAADGDHGSAWVPVQVCTLPTREQPLRVAEFDALFRDAARSIVRLSPTRLRVELSANAEAAARELAARESQCCSFFTFGFTRGAGAEAPVWMDIAVPAERFEVLDGLAARTGN
ncbi:hypothetical protein [Nocardia sp. NPDC003963]